MKKIIMLFVLSMLMSRAFSQYEDKYWIFGRNVTSQTPLFPGNMEFYNGEGSPVKMNPMPTIRPNGKLAQEGVTVVTDPKSGELKFYSDGRFVYDASHNLIDLEPMKVGFEELGGHPSCSQPVLVSVVPVCPFNQYYVFVNPTGTVSSANNDYSDGPISYRIYDAEINAFSEQRQLPGIGENENADEGMVIIPSKTDAFTFWLIYRVHNPVDIDGDLIKEKNVHLVYKISPEGIEFHKAQSFGPHINRSRYVVNIAYQFLEGSIAQLGFCFISGNVYTVNFDTETGEFIEQSLYNLSPLSGLVYDLEFSANKRFLYVSTYEPVSLYQIDMENGYNVVPVWSSFDRLRGGGLKKAPDGRMYFMSNGGSDRYTNVTVSVLNKQDELYNTNDRGFITEGVFTFTNLNAFKFPEFLVTPDWKTTVIVDDSELSDWKTLKAEVNSAGIDIVEYKWFKKDDGIKNSWVELSGENESSLEVTAPGIYKVEVFMEGGCAQVSKEVIVEDDIITGYRLRKNSNNLFDLYPNPSSDFVHLRFKAGHVFTGPLQVNILDMTGRTVLTSSPVSGDGEVRIAVAELSKGVYTLQLIETNGMVHTSTFVKLN